MNKMLKYTLALSLSLSITANVITPISASTSVGTDTIYSEEYFMNDGALGDIADMEDFQEIFTFSNDQGELNWYYVGKGKDNIAEPPKESASFLEENAAYYLGNTSEKVIYLTFDEGYENGNTGKILDILKELNVPAAFFVVKPYIDKEPELVKRMVSEGHIVGNHTVHHPSMAQIHDSEKFKAELTGVEDAYKELTGEEMPKFFRPPMGKYSEKSLAMTKNLGYKTVFWSFAYRDWDTDKQPSHEEATQKIMDNLHDGSILLLHAVSKTSTEILNDFISNARKLGYEFELLEY